MRGLIRLLMSLFLLAATAMLLHLSLQALAGGDGEMARTAQSTCTGCHQR